MVQVKNIKIAFIHPDLGIGGAERLVLDVAVALAKQGEEISFVTNHFDKGHAFEELKNGEYPVRVIGDWIPRSVGGIFQALFAYLRMIYLALIYIFFTHPKDKPDIYFVDQIPMAVPFLKWSSGKVIYYCHHPDLLASPKGGILKRLYRMPINWIEYKGTNAADVILVNSKYTAEVFRKTFPEITKKLNILYPTISNSYQKMIAKKQAQPIQNLVPEIQYNNTDIVVYLSINRFHPAKGLELAINAMNVLKQKLSPQDWNRVFLIMAGGYDPQSTTNAKHFSQLSDLANKKNLNQKVIFLKSPSDDMKANLLLACDCLIYTPVNEHFGIVPLEAMSASKPVIACNSGGPKETVQHEVSGFLCSPTAESMANCMVEILNKENSRAMGFKGKQSLENTFSLKTFENKIGDIVSSVVTSRRM